MYISTDAIILKNTKYKESSIISRIFTYDEGKISVIFKGAKKGKNNLSGTIEPGNIVYITYYNNNSSIKTVKEVSLKKIYFSTREVLENYYYSMAIISLLDKVCTENNPEKKLFTLTLEIFDSINQQNKSIDVLFLFFLVQLNKFLGFELTQTNSSNQQSLIAELNHSDAFLSNINEMITNKIHLINKAKVTIYKHMKEHLIDLNDIYAIKMIKNLNNETITRSN